MLIVSCRIGKSTDSNDSSPGCLEILPGLVHHEVLPRYHCRKSGVYEHACCVERDGDDSILVFRAQPQGWESAGGFDVAALFCVLRAVSAWYFERVLVDFQGNTSGCGMALVCGVRFVVGACMLCSW